MDRDYELKKVMRAITDMNGGCHISQIDDKDHLVVSNIDEHGMFYAPWIWLSISSRGEWFFQIMNEVGFIIPNKDDIAKTALGVVNDLTACMSITKETVEKYNLINANVFTDGSKLDIDYSNIDISYND